MYSLQKVLHIINRSLEVFMTKNGRNNINRNVAWTLLAKYLPGQQTHPCPAKERFFLLSSLRKWRQGNRSCCRSLATSTPRDLCTEFPTNNLHQISCGQRETSGASCLLHHSIPPQRRADNSHILTAPKSRKAESRPKSWLCTYF